MRFKLALFFLEPERMRQGAGDGRTAGPISILSLWNTTERNSSAHSTSKGRGRMGQKAQLLELFTPCVLGHDRYQTQCLLLGLLGNVDFIIPSCTFRHVTCIFSAFGSFMYSNFKSSFECLPVFVSLLSTFGIS